MKKGLAIVIFIMVVAILPHFAFAHEAYVLSPEKFHEGLSRTGFDSVASLHDPRNLQVFLTISFWILVLLGLNFIFRRTRAGRAIGGFLEKGSRFGPFVVRLAVSASFFFFALTGNFLGPELPLSALPFAPLIRAALFGISGMFLFGFLTEIAALIALVIYTVAVFKFGHYLATYLNYLGELMVLLLFGFRYFSLDGLVFGKSRRFPRLEKYQGAIVRVCYGLALCYTAVAVKFFHPALVETVVRDYNLTQFHYLFPSNPMLIALGAALAEFIIGVFIVIGFELRLTVFVSLIYITLSLLFFQELVWPHLLLYGISVSLLINKEAFTLDNFFDRRRRLLGNR